MANPEETKTGAVRDADDLFEKARQISAELAFPCAICGASFGEHSMGLLKQCFQGISNALSAQREQAAAKCEAMRPEGGRMWTAEQLACFEALSAAATAIRVE